MMIFEKALEVASNTKDFVVEHDTWFLTGISILGIGLTAYEAYKLNDTVRKAKDISANLKAKATPEEQLTPEWRKQYRYEMIRICAPNILALTASAGVAVGTVVACQKINSDRIEGMGKKIGELTALYNASETGRRIYEAQVEQVVGKDKAGDIKKQAITEQTAHSLRGDIYDTGNGHFLFYLPYTNQWFYSDTDHVKKAFEKLDSSLNPMKYWDEVDLFHRSSVCCTKGYFNLVDLCQYLEIPTDVVSYSDEMVWLPRMSMEPMLEYGGYPGTEDPVTFIRTFDPPIGRKAAKELYGI